jgi:phosphoribosylanthranilate isomerase
MRIKICGLFRKEDIDYVNESKPDYAGFVFAKSKRQVTAAFAKTMRLRLVRDIIPVGVFVNAPISEIVEMYNDNIISIAQLHGNENEKYIMELKETSGAGKEPIPVIKTCFPPFPTETLHDTIQTSADYLLFDSGAGTGKTFNWDELKSLPRPKPWFLAGGINAGNIKQAMALNPFALDVSGGAETDGIKNRDKIMELTKMARTA